MKHAPKEDFRWFTTVHNGILGLHKDNIYSIRLGERARLVQKDGTEWILHKDHLHEALNEYYRR